MALVVLELPLGRVAKDRYRARICRVAPRELEQALLELRSGAGAAERELAVDEALQEGRLIEVEQALVETLQEKGTVENGARELVLSILLISETECAQQLDEIA